MIDVNKGINAPYFSLTLSDADVTNDVAPCLLSLSYTDYLDGMSDELSVSFYDEDNKWINSWWPKQSDLLSLCLGYRANMVNFGDFELDEIAYNHPPSVVTLRALSTGLSKSNRTLKAKSYENTTLSGIIKTVAKRMKLQLTGEIKEVSITRVTQYQESDVAFLTRLAREYGHSFKIVKDKLVFTPIDKLSEQQPIMTLLPTDIITVSLRDRISSVAKSVKVVGYDSKKKRKISKKRKAKTVRKNSLTNYDELKIITKAENSEQMQARADAATLDQAQEQCAGSITLWGNPQLVAGLTVKLTNFGKFSGLYLINQSRHSVSRSEGYKTVIEIKMVKEE
ncbi:MAG: hypothetical protein KGV56_00035 [Gammaproteobacteria bacterium]|nr:hypothetical protein [Gammaproteobacteria bacterium]